jgi:hypothetical protein
MLALPNLRAVSSWLFTAKGLGRKSEGSLNWDRERWQTTFRPCKVFRTRLRREASNPPRWRVWVNAVGIYSKRLGASNTGRSVHGVEVFPVLRPAASRSIKPAEFPTGEQRTSVPHSSLRTSQAQGREWVNCRTRYCLLTA